MGEEDGLMLLRPIGRVTKGRSWPEGPEARRDLPPEEELGEIEIDTPWAEALEGVEGFSHLWVIWWLSRRDGLPVPLRVRPERREEMPLMGVFATRSPQRPCPIAMTAVELVAREDTRLYVRGLDAFQDTPILDIKPYIRRGDLIPEATMPDWLEQLWHMHDVEHAGKA